MADLQILGLPYGGFAVVAFALSAFNFVVSLWTIRSIRALKAKPPAAKTAIAA